MPPPIKEISKTAVKNIKTELGVPVKRPVPIKAKTKTKFRSVWPRLQGRGLAIQMFYAPLLRKIIRSWIEKKKKARNSRRIKKKSKVTFRNGNTYKGHTRGGMLHGKGVFRWKDGDKFTGQFRHNYPTGYGTYSRRRTHERYNGEFRLGVFHGHGEMIGRKYKYIGEFRNGQMNGEGILKASPFSFDGTFENDNIKNGYGYYDYGNYAGTFNSQSQRKYGKFIFRNNDTYLGNWSNDLFCDFGIYKWYLSGTIQNTINSKNNNLLITYKKIQYAGFWINGARHGFGCLQINDIFIFTLWSDNVKNGPGLMRTRNGEYFISQSMYCNDDYNYSFKLQINNTTAPILEYLMRWAANSDDPTNNLNISDILLDDDINILRVHKNEPVKFYTNTEKFHLIVQKLMLYIDYKCFLYPLYVPKYSLEKHLPYIEYIYSIYQIPPNNINEYILVKEHYSLTQVIIENLHKLEHLYNYYSNLNFADKINQRNFNNNSDHHHYQPQHHSIMSLNRLGLWLFYHHVFYHFPKIYAGEVIHQTDQLYHLITINPNDAFETIEFWKFLRHILNIVKILNDKQPNILENSVVEYQSFFGLFSTMLLVFLREFPLVQRPPSVFIQKYPKLMYELFLKISKIPDKLTIRAAYKFFLSIKTTGTARGPDQDYDFDRDDDDDDDHDDIVDFLNPVDNSNTTENVANVAKVANVDNARQRTKLRDNADSQRPADGKSAMSWNNDTNDHGDNVYNELDKQAKKEHEVKVLGDIAGDNSLGYTELGMEETALELEMEEEAAAGYLKYCSESDFLEISAKIFPQIASEDYDLLKSEFLITGLELMEIILLCFERDLYNLKANRMRQLLMLDIDKDLLQKSPVNRKKNSARISQSVLRSSNVLQ